MTEICSYAQNFEDVMLWRALGHVAQGFYIDLGAHDPVIDSVSHAFYENGWRGVHVEPSPHYADLLRSARAGEEVIAAAVGDASGLMTFYEIPGTGLSTADANIAQRHAQEGFEVRQVEVPAITLDELLSRYRDREVHWLKVDVEGHEANVLRGWTLAAPLPWVILVESTAPLSQEDTSAAWEASLLARGYRFAYFDGLNRFYVSKDHAELMAAFGRPPNVFDRFTLSGTASSTFTQRLTSHASGLEAQVAQARERLSAAAADIERLAAEASALQARLDDTARTREAAQREAESERDARRVVAADLIHERERLQRIELTLQAELARRDARYEALAQQRIAELHDRQRTQEAAAAELLAAQRRIGELARELTESHANVLHLRHSHAEAAEALAVARAGYETIRNSRSWRITAPLRALVGIGRTWRVLLRDTAAKLFRLPRRAAKRVLVSGLAHVRTHPHRKARLARLIRHSPRLDARLRRFAALNSGGNARIPPPLFAPPDPAPGESTRTAAPATGPIVPDVSGPASAQDVQEALTRSLAHWSLGPRRNV